MDARIVLSKYYHQHAIIASDIDITSSHSIVVTFVFPEYTDTTASLDHVSKNQISVAIVQGLVSHFDTLSSSLIPEIKTDFTFFSRFLYLKEELVYKQLLKPHISYPLNVTLEKIKNIRGEYYFQFGLSGFVTGKILTMLPR